MEANQPSVVPYHFSALACEGGAVVGIGQRGFGSEEGALQEAAQFLCDYCLSTLWAGLRLVTCARDADEIG